MPSASPPRKRAPRVPSTEARRCIIDAANRLLRERRYRELTVEDVMAEAGLTRTVFYRHSDGIASIVLGLTDEPLAAVDGIQRGVALGHTPPMPVRDVAEALNAMNANTCSI